MNNLYIIIRNKLWFHTVNRYRSYKLRKQLLQYESTLSPKQREWAQTLRQSLENSTPSAAAGILVREARRISDEQMRVTEAIDRVSRT